MPKTAQSGADPDATSRYALIERAIDFLRAQRASQPELAELAGHLGLSPTHTQRLFSRWAGISPKRFVQVISVDYAKQRMRETGDLLGVALDSGLSGSGRLHDLFVNLEGLSPGEYRRAAAGVTVRYGIGETPFGDAMVAFSTRGICRLAFVDTAQPALLADPLTAALPGAHLLRDDPAARRLLGRVFARDPADARRGLSLWVAGTNFQVQVWRALLRVPRGGLLSYGQLAGLLGQPRAARAVGHAMAGNPVAFLIPCHRVLRSDGRFGDYHWGQTRKQALCAWESGPAGRGQNLP